ncbi:MAG: hypothetical protein WCK55_17345 [Verrucomicrobiota bacterium]|nr:hypothetical protein [Verrucomicrobiota bacterium]
MTRIEKPPPTVAQDGGLLDEDELFRVQRCASASDGLCLGVSPVKAGAATRMMANGMEHIRGWKMGLEIGGYAYPVDSGNADF